MELLLLLLLPVALGGLLLDGGGDDDDDAAPGGVQGTGGDDVMRGNSSANTISGRAGDDLIFGYRGDDTLSGGNGTDLLDGGIGDDVLIGGNGGDGLVGGAGNDLLQGNAGEDLLMGGAGDDTMEGGDGDDILLGSTGADQMFGGAGDDLMDGVSPIAGNSLNDAILGAEEGSPGSIGNRGEFVSGFRELYDDRVTDADINRFLDDLVSEEGAHAPDALFGGAGEDALAGDNGDTLTGGADQDRFAVTWVSGNAPVVITDFVAMGEEFDVRLEDDGTVPTFGIRDAAGGAGLEVVVGGEVVAVLDNVTVATVFLGQFTISLTEGYGSSGYPAVVLPPLAA